MKNVFDSEKISFKCPKCGKALSLTVGKLKKSPSIRCRYCKGNIKIDGKDIRRSLKQTEKMLDDFGKSVRKINLRF